MKLLTIFILLHFDKRIRGFTFLFKHCVSDLQSTDYEQIMSIVPLFYNVKYSYFQFTGFMFKAFQNNQHNHLAFIYMLSFCLYLDCHSLFTVIFNDFNLIYIRLNKDKSEIFQ